VLSRETLTNRQRSFHMLRLLKFSVVLLATLFVAVQFVRPERVNPPAGAERALSAHVQVDAEVSGILRSSCMDCHSHQTVWPWYSNVAPVSWFVADHVKHGRKHLNFSDWARYDEREADEMLDGICQTAKGGVMPLNSYTLLHHEAKLSAAEVDALCVWSRQERQRLAAAHSARAGRETKLDRGALGRR
jgi:hypothetical protein